MELHDERDDVKVIIEGRDGSGGSNVTVSSMQLGEALPKIGGYISTPSVPTGSTVSSTGRIPEETHPTVSVAVTPSTVGEKSREASSRAEGTL